MHDFYKAYEKSISGWFLAILFCVTTGIRAQSPVVQFNPVITTGLSSPIDITHAADGTNRIFIVQRGGTVRYMTNGILSSNIFLNISSLISTDGERGLLSMAFHPAYASNGFFFVYYTDLNGDITIARYHVAVSTNPNVAEPASRQVLLTINHREFNNHNGGKLNFGSDGNLYFATGDGGSADDPHFNAQNGTVLLGKMMRINVDNFATAPPYYTIPAGNPYASPSDNIRDVIWAFGLRNPFRWSFDRLTHDMWIGDVGQNNREEIDFRPASNTGGINFGWRCYEGNRLNIDSGCLQPSGYTFPVFDYDRTNLNGGQSVTGGFVYRGTSFPDLYGWYICIDYVSSNAWLIRDSAGTWVVRKQSGLPKSIVAFGEDEAGELYAASLTGTIYRVQSASVLPLTLLYFKGAAANNGHVLTWKGTDTRHLSHFEVEQSSDGITFTAIGRVMRAGVDNAEYRFSNTVINTKTFYRLKIIDDNGRVTYSEIIVVGGSNTELVRITPTLVKKGIINIRFSQPFQNLQVSDLNGKLLKHVDLRNHPAFIDVDLSGLAAGVYIITCRGSSGMSIQKIVKE